MRFPRIVVIGLLAALTAGCLNSASLIRVKPDGSGTVEQTMLVNAAALKGLMGAMGGTGKASTATGPMMSDADFKRQAERMGARPVSLTPMKEGNFEGTKAIYAFDDVSKLRVDQDPQVAGAAAGVTSSSGSPVTFALSKAGGASVLTISVNEKAAAAATSKAQEVPSLDQVDPAMMQMIKTVFDGLRVTIDLEVDGKIVKTNADYVSGSRITLLELDANSVFQEEAKLRTLQSKIRPGTSLSELRPYLKDIKGVKINHPTVTIEFR